MNELAPLPLPTPPQKLREHLVIIGPSGAGKTTLGRTLSNTLDWPFKDLDEEFIKRYGSLQEMEPVVGEDGVDDILFEITERTLSRHDPSIITLSPRLIMEHELWELANKYGTTLFLHSMPMRLQRRIYITREDGEGLVSDMERTMQDCKYDYYFYYFERAKLSWYADHIIPCINNIEIDLETICNKALSIIDYRKNAKSD